MMWIWNDGIIFGLESSIAEHKYIVFQSWTRIQAEPKSINVLAFYFKSDAFAAFFSQLLLFLLFLPCAIAQELDWNSMGTD